MEKINTESIKLIVKELEKINDANKTIDELKEVVPKLVKIENATHDSTVQKIEVKSETKNFENKTNTSAEKNQKVIVKLESKPATLPENTVLKPENSIVSNQNTQKSEDSAEFFAENPNKRYAKGFSCSKKEQDRLDDMQKMMLKELNMQAKNESDLIRFCINIVYRDELWRQYPKSAAKTFKK